MRRLGVAAALPLIGLLACGAPAEDPLVDSPPEAVAVAATEDDDAPSEEMVEALEAARLEALEVLSVFSDFLSAQARFNYVAELGFDVVQGTGQRLEFGGTRAVTVRRPDHMHIEVHPRDGDSRAIRFDGENLSVMFPDQNAYLSLARPGNLDQILDYVVDDLGAAIPLADLLHASPYAEIVDRIEFGAVIGESTIAGIPCDHLAFRTDAVDVQLWIEQGDKPLLRRIVITYREEEGSPQFWAQLLEWDFEPEAPDDLFAFSPPEGAERLTVRPLEPEQIEAGE